MANNVCHITTAHPMYDVRIYFKECLTLKNHGFDVSLVITNDKDENVGGIKILALPKSRGRLERMIKKSFLAFIKSKQENASLYHFHDPELIFAGLALKALGKKVVYDVHESVSLQIISKEYIPKYLRELISAAFSLLEKFSAKHFDAVIAATPFINGQFQKFCCNCFNVNNYPDLTELHNINVDWNRKELSVCYVGAIDTIRGIREMVRAIGLTDARLILAGSFASPQQREDVSCLEGWRQVEDLGQVDRHALEDIFARAMAGLVLFYPEPNHLNAQPNKLFEYMAAGLPVIASDFPLWRDIIQKHRCGICVNPKEPEKIAEAIKWLFANPAAARAMGENGRKATAENYNWNIEGKKLISIYRNLLNQKNI